MPKKKKPTSDAVEILHRRYYRGRPDRIAQLEEARTEDELARTIYELREQAGLTQARLAKMIGTTESVISRLEDSGYKGHSLKMLKRIAEAVNKRVEIRFVPRKEKLQPEDIPGRQRAAKTKSVTEVLRSDGKFEHANRICTTRLWPRIR